MYCLKVEKIKNGNSDSLNVEVVMETTYTSYEFFKDLYEKKQMFDRKGNRYYKYRTSVYKVSNNGVRIEQLTDTNLYREIENVEKELKQSLTCYSYLRQVLDRGKRKYYVKDNVLYVSPKSLRLEIELVKKTPKYEVRQNGNLLFTETAQNEIIKVLNDEYGIRLDD